MDEKLLVKCGLHTFDRPMTRAGAMRLGVRNMPADLKRADFKVFVGRTCVALHGGVWWRISYGKKTH
jgi:hypothetical protein